MGIIHLSENLLIISLPTASNHQFIGHFSVLFPMHWQTWEFRKISVNICTYLTLVIKNTSNIKANIILLWHLMMCYVYFTCQLVLFHNLGDILAVLCSVIKNVTHYIQFFSVAVIKCQLCNSLLAYGSRGRVHNGSREAGSQQSDQEAERSH